MTFPLNDLTKLLASSVYIVWSPWTVYHVISVSALSPNPYFLLGFRDLVCLEGSLGQGLGLGDTQDANMYMHKCIFSISFQVREDRNLNFVFFLNRIFVWGFLDIAGLYNHMRAFPDAATGSAVEAIAGDMVVMDSVKDVA